MTKFALLAALEVGCHLTTSGAASDNDFKMTISGAVSDKNFLKITKFPLQNIPYHFDCRVSVSHQSGLCIDDNI